MDDKPDQSQHTVRDDIPGYQRHERNRRAEAARTDATTKIFARAAPVAEREFALIFAIVALVLFLLLPVQTDWVTRAKLYEQPAFWPAISLGVMVVFAIGFVIRSLRSGGQPNVGAEIWTWCRALEFVGWYLAYVWLVPYLGYLIATILFACCLAWRVGYRSVGWMVAAAVFGLVVVGLFKSLLGVNIPAGAIYDALPAGAVRSFLMTNF